MKLHCIAFALVIIGALNWGLIGLGGSSWNLVNLILGQWPMVENLVYILVGLSAIALVFSHNKQYLVKVSGALPPIIIPVQVVSESEERSAVRPESSEALKAGDRIIRKDALFLFRQTTAADL